MRTILIVDDEERLRKALKRSLQQEGGQTLAAGSAEEALGILEKTKVGLVITDLVMPGMDGMALVRKIKGSVPSMKMIILTAYGSPESMQEAEELGVDCYLAKPFDLSQLKSRVNELLPAAPQPSPEAPGRRNERQAPRRPWAAAGRTLGSAASFSRKALQRVKPTNVMFALGRAARTVSRVASVFRQSEVKQK